MNARFMNLLSFFLSGGCRLRFVSLAAAAGVRLGQRQRRRGDLVRLLSVADGTVRPATELR